MAARTRSHTRTSPQAPPAPEEAVTSDEEDELDIDSEPEPAPGEGPSRSGTVALIGRPNVGKSTLMNAALEQRLSIVSATPQTTRDAIVGVVRLNNAEIAFVDTPGLHKAESALGRSMNRAARGAAKDADIVVFVTDLPRRPPKGVALKPHPGDIALLADIAPEHRTILVINKIDKLKAKDGLLPLIAALAQEQTFESVVPISALEEDGVERVLAEIAKLLPEGPHRYDDDDITDRPVRFFASEYVREAILSAAHAEVPHAATVTVEQYEQPKSGQGSVHVSATIHVEREGQKRILVGHRGEMISRIGQAARLRLAELIGQAVHLELFVRVTPNWRDDVYQLVELGVTDAASARPSKAASAKRKPKTAKSAGPTEPKEPKKEQDAGPAHKKKHKPALKANQARGKKANTGKPRRGTASPSSGNSTRRKAR